MSGIISGDIKYPFTPMFERAVVYFACSSARFYKRIGAQVHAECLTSAVATLALSAAHSWNKTHGAPPTRASVVLQQLRTWMHEGKVTQEKIAEVSAYFDAHEDDVKAPPEEDTVRALVPILQDRMRLTAVRLVGEGAMKRSGVEIQRALDVLATVDRLGAVETANDAMSIDASGLAFLASSRKVDRIYTGIMELDEALGGGAPVPLLATFLGGTGDGKTAAMVQVMCAAAMQGVCSAYATLEPPKDELLARTLANLSEVAVDKLRFNAAGLMRDEQEKIAQVFARGGVGAMRVREFTPGVTTVADIKAWVAEEEQAFGRPFQCVLIDYDAKLSAGKKNGESSYRDAKLIYEALYAWQKEESKQVWTGSQARRREKGKRTLYGLDDFADSQEKPRAVDLVVALNVDEDQSTNTRMVTISTPKYRFGTPRVLPALPTDFAISRLAPVTFYGGAAGYAGCTPTNLRAATAVADLKEMDGL